MGCDARVINNTDASIMKPVGVPLSQDIVISIGGNTMVDDDRTPELKEALEATRPEERAEPVPEEEIPPPPGDWATHPITRVIEIIVLLAVIAVIVWKGPAVWAYAREHPFGGSLAIFFVAFGVLLIATAYWKVRAQARTYTRPRDGD